MRTRIGCGLGPVTGVIDDFGALSHWQAANANTIAVQWVRFIPGVSAHAAPTRNPGSAAHVVQSSSDMNRILVALDGSPRAPTVLAAAVELAQLARAKLVLFRAISVPVELTPDMLAMPPANIEQALCSAARAALEQVAAKIAPGIVESIETRVGVAWDAIVRASRELDADLVVLGSHGYGGLDRLLGTTAAKVANHIDRNVLIVRNAL